jgi:5-methylcytosine-specific restriction endonuclease McrA
MKNGIDHNALLSDAELLNEVKRLTGNERQATSRLIAALGELDARRLYLGEGCSSLFTYCTQVLHLSEHAAYGRIEAARAARKWPLIIGLIEDSSLHLTAVSLLAPHLTHESHREILGAARHKSKRQVEELVAALRPQPAVASSVRKLPAPKPAVLSAPSPIAPTLPALNATLSTACPGPPLDAIPQPADPPARAEVRPLAPERYKIQFTVSRATYDQLREVQDLLRHRVPSGDVAEIFNRALTLLLSELHRARHAATTRPRVTSAKGSGRHIPATVKREVWRRDEGRCAFVGSQGRCTERGFLEYHHVLPFADGGLATVDNLELRCKSHNAYEAERWLGVDEGDVVREIPAAFCPEGLIASDGVGGEVVRTVP